RWPGCGAWSTPSCCSAAGARGCRWWPTGSRWRRRRRSSRTQPAPSARCPRGSRRAVPVDVRGVVRVQCHSDRVPILPPSTADELLALRAEREHHLAALDALDVGLLVVAADGTVLLSNRAYD